MIQNSKSPRRGIEPRRADEPLIRIEAGGKIWTNTHSSTWRPGLSTGTLRDARVFLYSTYGGGERIPYEQIPQEHV